MPGAVGERDLHAEQQVRALLLGERHARRVLGLRAERDDATAESPVREAVELATNHLPDVNAGKHGLDT